MSGSSFSFSASPRSPQLATYHYRPWLYPLILGASYKLFGYKFAVGRRVNVVIYAVSVAIIVGLLFFFVSPMSALFGLSAFFLVEGFTRRTTAFLAEPSQGLALSLLLAALVLLAKRPKSIWAGIAVGAALGLCMLSKQMFAPIAVLVIGGLMVSRLVTRSGFLFLSVRVGRPLATLLFGSMLFFVLFRSTGGRTFDAFWPLIAFLAALPASSAVGFLTSRWRPPRISKARWSSAKRWMFAPGLSGSTIARPPNRGKRISGVRTDA